MLILYINLGAIIMIAIEPSIKKNISFGMIVPFIFFLIVGSMMILNGQRQYRSLQPNEAVQVTATFKDYSLSRIRQKKEEIELNFIDRDSLKINPVCISNTLKNNLRNLPAGCSVDMLLHPDSYTILSIKADNDDILSFDTTQNQFKRLRTILLVGGILFYICGIIFTIKLNSRRKKFMQNKGYYPN